MEATQSLPAITEQLCEAFVFASDALVRRRAGEIPDATIEEFIALGWMRWHGGSLQVTALGQMALMRISDRLAEAVA